MARKVITVNVNTNKMMKKNQAFCCTSTHGFSIVLTVSTKHDNIIPISRFMSQEMDHPSHFTG
jgi:quinolinate synthase